MKTNDQEQLKPERVTITKVSWSFRELYDDGGRGELSEDVSVFCEITGSMTFDGVDEKPLFEVTAECVASDYGILSYRSTVHLDLLSDFLDRFFTEANMPSLEAMGYEQKRVGVDLGVLGGPTERPLGFSGSAISIDENYQWDALRGRKGKQVFGAFRGKESYERRAFAAAAKARGEKVVESWPAGDNGDDVL